MSIGLLTMSLSYISFFFLAVLRMESGLGELSLIAP